LSRSFADRRREGTGKFAGTAILATATKVEFGLRHLDPLAPALVQHPDLGVERDLAADRIAGMHRLKKGDVRDRKPLPDIVQMLSRRYGDYCSPCPVDLQPETAAKPNCER
jgi:hypothetical protein